MAPPPSDESHEAAGDVPQPKTKQEAPVDYPSMQKRILIMTSVYLAIFLITLVVSSSRYFFILTY